MAKAPFKGIGPGGKLMVPNAGPNKQSREDGIMEWQLNRNSSGEPFTEPRKPGDTLHLREDNDVEGYGEGGRVKAGTDTCCSQFPHTSKAR